MLNMKKKAKLLLFKSYFIHRKYINKEKEKYKEEIKSSCLFTGHSFSPSVSASRISAYII